MRRRRGARSPRGCLRCRRLTDRELDERSTRLAHGLGAAGVGIGEHVGLCMRNTVEHLESLLACYKLRAVPININWRYEASELAYLFADADTVVVLHDEEFAAAVRSAASHAPVVRRLLEAGGEDYRALVASGSAARDLGPRSPDDSYVLYTGGTTGRPKGVVWRQEDIFFAAIGGGNPGGPPIVRAEELGPNVLTNTSQRVGPFLAPDDPGPERYATFSMGPLMHASGSWGALGTVLGGGALVLDPEPHFDAVRVLDLVERERVCLLTLVGDSGGRPLAEAVEAEPARWDLSCVRLLGSGGSILSADVKARLLDAIPSVLAILEGMGSSESPAQAVSVTARGAAVAPTLTFAAKPETIVVDADLRPLPPGRGLVGRLATRGRVPLAYYKDPGRSARTFVTIDGDRYALPGDRATVDSDGTIHLVGRGSACINTGGEKVYPEEVEAALLTHDGVLDVVVVGVPHEHYGSAVCAIVQPAGDAVTLDAVRDHCHGLLAGYKAPRKLVLVDAITRTAAGKPDYTWAHEIASPGGRVEEISSNQPSGEGPSVSG